MKKGFTLVELLAVVALLGLLSLIVVPVVDKLIKDGQSDLSAVQIKAIEDGARDWGSQNIFSLPANNGDVVKKYIYELEQGGFIEVDIKNPKTGNIIDKNSCVEITRTEHGFEYEYIETACN